MPIALPSSGAPGDNCVKAKTVITWVSAADGVSAVVRLFPDQQPDADGKNLPSSLNPNSLNVKAVYIEPSLVAAVPDQNFQFERYGYFVADRTHHGGGGKVEFNQLRG